MKALNEVQRHLLETAAKSESLVFQLPAWWRLPPTWDSRAWDRYHDEERAYRADIDHLWLNVRALDLVNDDDEKKQLKFRITAAGRAILAGEKP